MPELQTSGPASRTPAQPLEPPPPRRGPPLWFKGLAPLVLLAALVFVFLRVGPVGVFRATFPPIEELTLERIRLPEAGVMEVSVVNGGPQPVTVAQVMVDDANWVHTVNGSRTLERLERRTVRIPYPWVEGEPHTVTLVTSTGLTFSTEVAGRHALARGGCPLPRHLRAARRVCRRDPGVHRAALAAVRSRGGAEVDRLLPQPHHRPAGLSRCGCGGRGAGDVRAGARCVPGTRPGRVRGPGHAPGDRGDRRVARPGPRGERRRSGSPPSSPSASGSTTSARASRSARPTPPERSRSAPSW